MRPWRRPGWRARTHLAHAWLVQPVHASTLGTFRMLFGVCMVVQARHFGHMYHDFVQSKLLLPYASLDWMPPVGQAAGNAILLTNLIAAMLVTVGLRTREATAVLCASFTYLFCQCESFHNNHYILICHATFLGSLTGWGRWASLDAVLRSCAEHRRHFRAGRGAWFRDGGPIGQAAHLRALVGAPPAATVPYWNLLAFQVLFSIPYAYGAVAKMNEDWLLRAQPLTAWFKPGSSHSKWLPWGVGDTWWWPWLLAWGGFFFDGGIVPLLFSRHLRSLSFTSALAFNGMNKLMFNIGVFPCAMPVCMYVIRYIGM